MFEDASTNGMKPLEEGEQNARLPIFFLRLLMPHFCPNGICCFGKINY
jgi:hypothetical protein